jgi:TolB protein
MALLFFALSAPVHHARGQTAVGSPPLAVGSPPSAVGPVVIDVSNPNRQPYRIAIPVPVLSDPAAAKLLADILTADLAISSFFQPLDPKSFLADLQAEGLGIRPPEWTQVAAQGVIKASVVVAGGQATVTFHLFEVVKGDRPVLVRELRGTPAELRRFAHLFASDVVRYFTGEDGLFTSQLAFSAQPRRGVREILVMDYDGANVRSVTSSGSLNILPAWSPDGSQLAYTSYRRGTPDLYVGPVGGGRPTRVAAFPGMNSGAAWSPDGSKIAATLSKDGDPDIYLLSPRGEILKQLTDDPGIDTSPTWSPDGSQIAFVSNRRGGVQIYVMSAAGGTATRVTFRGNYNTEPKWCPRKDMSLLAFTARDERRRFDIFTLDLKNQQYTRLTEEGSDATGPAWAPGGRALAFVRGGGLWIMTADGKEQRAVWRGNAASPAWGVLGAPGAPAATSKSASLR